MHYMCSACSVEFVSGDVQIDHTSPVVEPSKGFISWDVYVDRLFCEKDNLSVLCKPCHAEKTAAEKKLRKKK